MPAHHPRQADHAASIALRVFAQGEADVTPPPPRDDRQALQSFRRLLDEVGRARDAGRIRSDEAVAEVAQRVCALLECSRASVWLVEGERPGQRRLRRLGGWCDDDGRTLDASATLGEAECPRYFQVLLREGLVVSTDTLDDPVLDGLRHRYLRPRDARALLDVAIGANGAATGILCCEQHGHPRHWSKRDIALLRRLAVEISLRHARRGARARASQDTCEG